jgi:hypothetical protein
MSRNTRAQQVILYENNRKTPSHTSLTKDIAILGGLFSLG